VNLEAFTTGALKFKLTLAFTEANSKGCCLGAVHNALAGLCTQLLHVSTKVNI
jgi:hypothetical protein